MKFILFFVILIFNGCGPHFVLVTPGADGVSVVDSINKDICEIKGTNSVRITGYAERLPEYINKDLIQLSKNAAFKMGANTIIMLEQYEKGRGTQSAKFEAYMCD